ncbi:MAG: xanthine dehydrogenase small subunit [Rhodobacteraceae bacterium]|nr:xanthine dehydrogenase small subunit [Paracoccaceae bacterium]
MDITFLLNGETVTLNDVDPTRSVLDWLRESRGLKGTKEGCNEGDCGACTIILLPEAGDEKGASAVNACITMLAQLHRRAIRTIEGIANPDASLHPVQDAMVEHHGSQCGFCTPGIVNSLVAAQLRGDDDFDDVLAGNLCRCTGYAPVIRAAHAVAYAGDPVLLADRPDELPAPALPFMPETSDELADWVMANPHATLVAGATDISLWLTKGLRDLHGVGFLGGCRDLQHIVAGDDGLRIGAGVTISQLRAGLGPRHPHFAAMLRRFASQQIRSAATIGGNIANGSPIGDTPPPLIALGARLHLRRGDAHRVIRLEDYFIEYGRQDLQAGEFIEAVTIPNQPDRLKVYKVSKRFDQDISAVLGAFNIEVNDGIVKSVRIAFGGMAAVPKRSSEVEKSLIGQKWTRETVNNTLPVFARDFTPLSDMRASAAYRLEVAQNMLVRFWLEDQGEVISVREVSA